MTLVPSQQNPTDPCKFTYERRLRRMYKQETARKLVTALEDILKFSLPFPIMLFYFLYKVAWLEVSNMNEVFGTHQQAFDQLSTNN